MMLSFYRYFVCVVVIIAVDYGSFGIASGVALMAILQALHGTLGEG